MSIWKSIHWKWLRAVQLLASEKYLIELVLAGCKCGEIFTILVCTPFTCKTSCPFDWLHFALSMALGKEQVHTKFFFFTDRLRSTWAEWPEHGIHTSGGSIIITPPRKHISRTVCRISFCTVLLEAKLSGRLYFQSAWHPSATSVSWKINSQYFLNMFVSASDKSCGCSNMTHLILVGR